MLRRPHLLVALAIALGFASALAQQPSIPRLDGSGIAPAQIDSMVSQWMESAHVTGAGIAIFEAGRIAVPQSIRPARYSERLAAHAGFRNGRCLAE